MVLFASLIIRLFELIFLARTVFRLIFSAKRTEPMCACILVGQGVFSMDIGGQHACMTVSCISAGYKKRTMLRGILGKRSLNS